MCEYRRPGPGQRLWSLIFYCITPEIRHRSQAAEAGVAGAGAHRHRARHRADRVVRIPAHLARPPVGRFCWICGRMCMAIGAVRGARPVLVRAASRHAGLAPSDRGLGAHGARRGRRIVAVFVGRRLRARSTRDDLARCCMAGCNRLHRGGSDHGVCCTNWIGHDRPAYSCGAVARFSGYAAGVPGPGGGAAGRVHIVLGAAPRGFAVHARGDAPRRPRAWKLGSRRG